MRLLVGAWPSSPAAPGRTPASVGVRLFHKGRAMAFWGLDLGTKCGFAVRLASDNLVSGTWVFTPRRGDSYGTRFLRFERALRELLLDSGRPDLIAYEEVRAHKGTAAAHVYGGMQAILTKWCETEDLQYATCTVSDVKRAATSKGNAPKAAVEEAARQRWPNQMIVDDNQADALWILHLAETGQT